MGIKKELSKLYYLYLISLLIILIFNRWMFIERATDYFTAFGVLLYIDSIGKMKNKIKKVLLRSIVFFANLIFIIRIIH